MTGLVLNMTGFVLNMTGFILINLALIVVKQHWWRKRNFVPERLGDPGGSGPRTPTSQVEGAGPGSPIISVFPALFRPQKTSGRAHPFATFWGRVVPRSI